MKMNTQPERKVKVKLDTSDILLQSCACDREIRNLFSLSVLPLWPTNTHTQHYMHYPSFHYSSITKYSLKHSFHSSPITKFCDNSSPTSCIHSSLQTSSTVQFFLGCKAVLTTQIKQFWWRSADMKKSFSQYYFSCTGSYVNKYANEPGTILKHI